MSIVLRVMASASVGFFLLAITLRLTGFIVRERQMQTLDSLLLLPMSSREILSALLRGNLLRNWPWILLIAETLTGLLIFGDNCRVVALGFLLLAAVYVYFFAMLGLCLSITCRTMVSAYVSLAIIMGTLIMGPYVTTEFIGMRSLNVISPIECWLSVSKRAPLRPEEFGSICVYALAAIVLHRLAYALFARRAHR
jgi:ABC-type transport system involved in multi-copper enzyme maturation permease subunit